MRRGTIWTPALDARLLALRWDGQTWDAIAAEMGIGRYTVVERGRRLGARRAPRMIAAAEDPGRPARPAGHPACWDLLIAGTVLEGAAYPYPVFT
ncbi:MAG: hypothetical protein ACU0B1_10480 [Thermohalobaculum sp.]